MLGKEILESNIAIVMTTYNGERFLSAQIESILNQSLPPKIIIVCDDASTDRTTEILTKFQMAGKLIWHANETNLGVAANFKKVISLVPDGYYFAISDQDDIWDRNKLEISMHHLKKIEKVDAPCMVYSDLRLMSEDKTILNPSFQNELGTDKYIHCIDTLLFGNLVLGCTCLCNHQMKAYIHQMPISKAFNHDAWIALVAYSLGYTFNIKQPLVSYRQHDQNVTITDFKKQSRLKRYLGHLHMLFFRNQHLEDQIFLVKSFLKIFSIQLPENVKEKMQAFTLLQGKPYWRKKWALEKAFRGKWINRFF